MNPMNQPAHGSGTALATRRGDARTDEARALMMRFAPGRRGARSASSARGRRPMRAQVPENRLPGAPSPAGPTAHPSVISLAS